jgi:hypothetical protein
MTRRDSLVQDHLRALDEVNALAAEVAAVERAHGSHAEIEDARGRIDALRDDLLRQLAALLGDGIATSVLSYN